jgi:hypothetical protein
MRTLVVVGVIAAIALAWAVAAGWLTPECRLMASKIVGSEIRVTAECNALGRMFWKPDQAFAFAAVSRAFQYHLGDGGVTVRCAWPGNCWVVDKTPASRAGEPFTGR